MKSIRSRLLAMLLVFIIIPYFLSVLLIYCHTKQKAEQHELADSRDQIQKTAEDLEEYYEDLLDLPYILYRNPDLFRIFEKGFESAIYFNQLEIDKGMKTFYLMRREIRQIRIYIAKGEDSFTVYDAMVSPRKHQPEIMRQLAIRRLMGSKSNVLIEPPHRIQNYHRSANVPQSDKTMVLTIHHKMVDVLSNEVLGVVTIDFDLNRLADICSRITHGVDETVYLTDSNGYVMYASDPGLIGSRPDSQDQAAMLTSIGRGNPGDIVLSNKLTGALNDWQLTKFTSSRLLYRDARETAYSSMMVGGGMMLLGLIMVSIISDRITRPIRLLSRKIRRIEGGNMDVPFNSMGKDEIGHLERHIKEMMNRINTHIERQYKLEIENRTNQFRALKSQINPHFLYNALQSIGAVALRSHNPEVYRLITSLSKMMRYTIRGNQWTTVRKEIEHVEAYLLLQAERFRSDFQYTIAIEEALLDFRIPAMIIQPLVENFFKHGVEEGWHEAQLRIYAEMNNDRVTLAVENDGPGLADEPLRALRNKLYGIGHDESNADDHIGLKNIHDRLVLNYGWNAGIILESDNGQGFKVLLVIPVLSGEGALA
ncbi:cache domain-containing sensor histidine kinase [Paenibacillus beijingensis]|uniref:Histidine kinase n=1 Tax=Paenibacillus beijingensis TaxID=1126833 RepID=A0A0D5NLS9_9BACL|nr:sensor histidine kinase [Paenibacillus beijingensis]AJY75888.1 histidine kinase [Paenibacillus beijingensis]